MIIVVHDDSATLLGVQGVPEVLMTMHQMAGLAGAGIVVVAVDRDMAGVGLLDQLIGQIIEPAGAGVVGGKFPGVLLGIPQHQFAVRLQPQ